MIAAMAFSASVSAQTALSAKGINQPRDLSTVKVEKKMSMEAVTAPKAMKKTARVAAADGDIYGDWVSTQLDYRGEAYGAQTVTLEKADLEDKDGTVYNVLLKNFWMDGTEAYGIYNEKEGTISFPSQVIAQSTKALGYSTEYGRLALYCITVKDEVTNDPLVLVKDDEGNFVLQEDIAAYYIYAEDYVDEETGEKGAGWDYAYELQILPINGYMNFFTTAERFKIDPATEGWAEGENFINYQDFETNVMINGFLGMGVISIDINDDGTCSMQLQQTLGMDYYGADYGYMRLIGVGDDPDRPGYIMIMEDKESSKGDIYRNVELKGEVQADVIRFYDHDDNGYIYNEYYYGASSPDADGRWYTLGGFFCALELDLFHAGDTGVEELGMTREQKIKSTKTYNLMGQQVDRKTAKGLLIRDGKKYIAK
jgi:hypothetical protein